MKALEGMLPLPRNLGRGIFQYEDIAEQAVPRTENESPEEVTVPNLLNPTESPPTAVSQASDQPDAEPGNISNGDVSSGYAPSTPAEETENPHEEDPANVPIPVSDDDELMVDYWSHQGNQLVRHHVVPRQSAFDPSTCFDCPVNILAVKEQRQTIGQNTSGHRWTHSDSWGNSATSWETSEEWTGCTLLEVISEEELQRSIGEDEDSLCVTHDNHYICEVFLTQNDLDRLQNSPEELPTLAATAAKKQRAEVKLKDLSPEEIKEFQVAKNKELDQWIATKTIRGILRNKIPEQNILRARWVMTWKDLAPAEAAQCGRTRKAKARLVILGYEDPNLTEIPRDSPTLQRESRAMIMQYCSAKRWLIRSFDIQTAFLRGSRRDSRVLGLDPPPELRQKLGLSDGHICELLKSAYGLVNAPFLWYQELRDTLLAMNFRMSPLDPCLFVLVGDNNTVHGLLGTHVDDGLCAGDSVFEATLRKLEDKFPFGAKHQKEFTFTGIHVRQDDEFNIHLDQKDYVLGIPTIVIERNRRKDEKLLVFESERQQLRGLIGSLQYAASNTRPDISARLSFLQSKITSATISDLLEANRLLMEAKRHADTTITISHIPDDKIRFVS